MEVAVYLQRKWGRKVFLKLPAEDAVHMGTKLHWETSNGNNANTLENCCAPEMR